MSSLSKHTREIDFKSAVQGLLADVFLEFLQPYVEYEKRQLQQELEALWAADKANNFAPQSLTSHKLDSTTALLVRIRDVAERCSKVANKGKMYVKFATIVDEILQVRANFENKRSGPIRQKGATTLYHGHLQL